jgi:hypothetical protein
MLVKYWSGGWLETEEAGQWVGEGEGDEEAGQILEWGLVRD